MKTRIPNPLASSFLAFCTLCAFSAQAQTASASELLEKGIYAEETKGDLDAAIALYQQLVAEAKANARLAAQAQFRLGQCLLKKNRTADAHAAFEQLIKSFPDEKELIAKARAHLPGELALGPVPWQDGEEIHLAIKLADGRDIGAMVYRARAAEVDGRKVWQVGSRMFAQVHSFSQVEVAMDDFRPLRSRWMHGLLGDVSAIYHADRAELQRVGQPDPKTVLIDRPVYDNEQVMHLMRRLPLADGYKATIPVFSSLGGGNVIPISLEVKGTEVVETKAGRRECFKVDLAPVNQTFWFSTDAVHTVLKFGAGPITAELVEVTQRRAGEPVRFRDAALKVALAAPADWVIHRQDPDKEPNTESIYLLDPEAQAESCLLRLHAMTALSTAEKQSSRAWAELHAAKLGERLKAFKVRPESWSSLTVGGRPAAGFVADYRDNEKPLVLRGVYALGAGQNAEQFVIAAEPEKYDALRPVFEAIVASYETK